MATEYSKRELMAVRASKELRDEEIVFVGIGLPNLACNLARATQAPNLFMIYESGAVGTVPERLPISIGDPALVTDSLAVVPQSDIFHLYLQRGLIEVGFLGGAQIDPYGNINTTVIGDYQNPKIRLPGSGGACEIATHCRRLLVVLSMSPRTFVKKCDFITSPGHPEGGRLQDNARLPGKGPEKVITDKGVLDFDETGRMRLIEIFPGLEVDDVKSACGWDLKVADDLQITKPPSEESIRLLREVLDPDRLYL